MNVGLEEFLKQVPTLTKLQRYIDRENYSSKARHLLFSASKTLS